ncbi:MAG TPA: VanZ family protein [Anaerolineae bacterium]|nr:VanZ family protein [Anaerolineae bacterium]
MESVSERSRTSLRSRVIDSWFGRWAPIGVWLAFIYFLSAQPEFPDIGATRQGEDLIGLIVHLALYAILAGLLCRALASNRRLALDRVAFVLLCSALYALSDEWHQSFVPSRESSLADWLTDLIGAAVGCLAYLRLRRSAGRTRQG